MSDSDESTKLYAEHLEALRTIEADRTKFLIEALAALKSQPQVKRSDKAERKGLRDFFAAHVLSGLLSCDREYAGSDSTVEGRVALAFRYADAALAERSKP